MESVLTPEALSQIFPQDRANQFFDALFGDANEGAYDIELAYAGSDDRNVKLELRLHERPGRCLACNLTQGLPQVFERHPVINLAGVAEDVARLLGDQTSVAKWSLGYTEQRQKEMHVIPLNIELA
ncbi:MAG: pancreas/duodenum homeobox protein 1 [Thermodesulfobacteriota bacterium]